MTLPDTSTFIVPTKRKKASDLSVIILGSLSMYRCRTLGAVSMLPINNQPLLHKQISSVKNLYPLSEMSVVVGYYANQVINNRPEGVRIIENQLYNSTGNAEEMRLALNATLNTRALIIGGNVLFDHQALKQLQNHSSCILVGDGNSPDSLGTMNSSGKLEILSYGLKNKWFQIAMLEEPELSLLRKFVSRKERERYLFHEVINYIVNNGGKINVVKSTVGQIKTIESSKDI